MPGCSDCSPAPGLPGSVCVALTGNPNCGKTTLFNALTGLRAKVGNYSGVTVERKEGRLKGGPAGTELTLIDLPGTYSLSPRSLDEQISRDVLFHRLPEVPPLAGVVVVMDASNLQRNLYYATQVIELGHPTIIALNMMDVAAESGHRVEVAKLAHALGVPVAPMVASTGQGVAELRQKIIEVVRIACCKANTQPGVPTGSSLSPIGGARSPNEGSRFEPMTGGGLARKTSENSPSPIGWERAGVRVRGEGWGEGADRFTGMESAREMEGVSASATVPPPRFYELPGEYAGEVEKLAVLLTQSFPDRKTFAHAEALLLLTDAKGPSTMPGSYPAEIQAAVTAAQQRLEAAGADWRTDAIGARYARLTAIYRDTVVEGHTAEETFSDKLDRLVMHKVWGLVIFLGVMALMFQSIFRLAKVPMNLLTEMVDRLGHGVGALMGPGPLNDLLVGGVIAGVGAVVVFLPQILLLFLFISLLEDTGYMARAAFIMDRLMSKVGLHGKCFIPMLSCFACAIPGIMAARTIESQKDRLITILIAPLMTCSARLPVYTLLIAACIPERTVLGVFTLAGLTLLVMYFLGTAVALAMGWLFKKTILKGEVPLLIMELPPYKRPALKQSLRHMWDRAKIFLRQAGTVILGINVVLWFLSNYPQASVKAEFQARRAEAVRAATGISVTATAGKSLEEVMARFHENLGKTGASSNTAVAVLAQVQALDKEEAGERLRRSFAGHLGRLIEPIIAPLGFDWKIGIGIVSSFAAREVFVSTMSLVYNVGSYDQADTATHSLVKVMQDQKRPDGRLVFSALTGLTLMVFYVFALQCASTVVVVRRETNSWRWPIFQWVYLAMLAWSFSLFVYQGGRFLGLN